MNYQYEFLGKLMRMQFKLEKRGDKGQWVTEWANTDIYNLIKEYTILL